MAAGLIFTKRVQHKKQMNGRPIFCDYHKTARSAVWTGNWLGYPIGNFCNHCKKEWESRVESLLR